VLNAACPLKSISQLAFIRFLRRILQRCDIGSIKVILVGRWAERMLLTRLGVVNDDRATQSNPGLASNKAQRRASGTPDTIKLHGKPSIAVTGRHVGGV